MKENQKFISRIGIRYFIGTLIITGVQLGAANLANYLAPAFYEKFGFLVAMLPMYIIAIPILILMVKQIPEEVAIEKKKIKISALLGYFVVAYAAMYISNLLGNLLASLIGMIKGSAVQNNFMQVATTNNLWMNFLVMVICAPIIEEFIFRKVLIDRLGRFGEKFAIVLSALMFAFFHGNIYQFCYAFTIGLVFAYVYVKYGNVLYTIILHSAINFIGSIVAISVLKLDGIADLLSGTANVEAIAEHPLSIVLFFGYFMMIFAFTIAGIVVFLVNKKKITLLDGKVQIAEGELFKTVVCNVGMGLYLLFWVAFMVYMTVI